MYAVFRENILLPLYLRSNVNESIYCQIYVLNGTLCVAVKVHLNLRMCAGRSQKTTNHRWYWMIPIGSCSIIYAFSMPRSPVRRRDLWWPAPNLSWWTATESVQWDDRRTDVAARTKSQPLCLCAGEIWYLAFIVAFRASPNLWLQMSDAKWWIETSTVVEALFVKERLVPMTLYKSSAKSFRCWIE